MKLLFIATVPLMIAILIVGLDQAFGQSTTELKQEVAATSGQTDLNTIIAGGGLVSVGLAITKQLLDQRKNKDADKQTDRDVGKFILLMIKYFQYGYVLDPYMKKILDSPIDNNPLNSKISLGSEIADEGQGWVDYLRAVIQVPTPNMGVAITPVNPAVQEATGTKTTITTTPAKPATTSTTTQTTNNNTSG